MLQNFLNIYNKVGSNYLVVLPYLIVLHRQVLWARHSSSGRGVFSGWLGYTSSEMVSVGCLQQTFIYFICVTTYVNTYK